MSGIESCGPVTALTLGLPSTTAVMHPRGRLTKERFYTNTKVGKRLRQHFIEEKIRGHRLNHHARRNPRAGDRHTGRTAH